MRLILILLSCGIFVSGNPDAESSILGHHRPSRGIVHGVDLRSVLAAIEPTYAQQYVFAPPLVQHLALPVTPTVQYSLPIQSSIETYNAPAPEQSYNAPSQEVSSFAVSSSQGSSGPAPQPKYQAPENIQPPQREYSVPKAETQASQSYSLPAHPSSQYSPSGKYGAPAPVPQSRPPGYEEYGLPSNAKQSSSSYGSPAGPSPQPNSNYGPAPQPSSSYAPAGPSPQPSSNYGGPSGDFLSGGFPSGYDDITKDITIHVPPADEYSPPYKQPIFYDRGPKKARKNYKIIFIKAPTPAPPPQPILPEVEPEPEQKTLVYVLVPKQEAPKPIVIPTPAPAPKSKPEVYYVKYRQPIDSQEAVFGGPENFERGSPIGLDEAIGRPNQNFDLPKAEITQAKTSGY